MSDRDHSATFELQQALLAMVGNPLALTARILDFGCGEGDFVRVLRATGFTAYGCDFDENVGESDGTLAAIENPYRLPFSDAAFDCVLSNQVFEHVMDYDQALREIRRVLAPGGVSLHIFPARWRLREPHVYVPLATVIRSPMWLSIWAMLGIRNEFQADMSAGAVALVNRNYLREQTAYHTRRETLRSARRVFPDARLLDVEQLAGGTPPNTWSNKHRAAYGLARRLPLLATAWCETHQRVLLLPG